MLSTPEGREDSQVKKMRRTRGTKILFYAGEWLEVIFTPTEVPILKFLFWLGSMVLTQISRSLIKQSRISLLTPHVHIYVLGCFVNVLVSFGYVWRR